MAKLVKIPSNSMIPERDIGKSPILECVNLGIQFGGLKAVDDFNLTIGRTEIAGLIGPNGAGKTTVFNLLTESLSAHPRDHPAGRERYPRDEHHPGEQGGHCPDVPEHPSV